MKDDAQRIMKIESEMDSKPENVRRRVNITLIGDSSVGKSTLAAAYLRNKSVEPTGPTQFEIYSKNVAAYGYEFTLNIMDIGGEDDRYNANLDIFHQTDCFLACFAVNSEASYNSVSSRWMPTVRDLCPAASVILVATKSDLRLSDTPDAILHYEGLELQGQIKADLYLECSARCKASIDEVFDYALLLISTKVQQAELKSKRDAAKNRGRDCCPIA